MRSSEARGTFSVELIQNIEDLKNLILMATVKRAGTAVREGRDRLCSSLEVDRERTAAEILRFANTVDKVRNHARSFNERETEDHINSDVGACGNEKRCSATVLGVIGQVKFEPDR